MWKPIRNSYHVNRQEHITRSLWRSQIAWSFLATYGNNPLVKLAILAPLFAQVLIHQDTVAFLQQYDFTKLEWLYASLMCFFVAQLIYNLGCHQNIKDYPSEIKFIQAMEATTPDEDLNIDYFDVYKKFFSSYGGRLEIGTFGKQRDISFETQHQDLAAEKIDDEVFSIFNSVYFHAPSPVDWKILYNGDSSIVKKVFESMSGSTYNDKQKSDVTSLITDAKKEMTSSHWRAKAIKRRYDKLNTRNPILRYFAGLLYLLGTVYFLYTGSQNILKVLCQYGWLPPISDFCIWLNQ